MMMQWVMQYYYFWHVWADWKTQLWQLPEGGAGGQTLPTVNGGKQSYVSKFVAVKEPFVFKQETDRLVHSVQNFDWIPKIPTLLTKLKFQLKFLSQNLTFNPEIENLPVFTHNLYYPPVASLIFLRQQLRNICSSIFFQLLFCLMSLFERHRQWLPPSVSSTWCERVMCAVIGQILRSLAMDGS